MAPKFLKLLIPRKNSDKVRDLDTNWHAIEVWASQLPAAFSSGTTFYASLTGTGETTSPGDLTQDGQFVINVGPASYQFLNGVVKLLSRVGDLGDPSANFGFAWDEGFDTVTVATNAGGGFAALEANGTIVNIQEIATGELGFFNVTAVTQAANIANPTGGATIDLQARNAIGLILILLKNYGLMAP